MNLKIVRQKSTDINFSRTNTTVINSWLQSLAPNIPTCSFESWNPKFQVPNPHQLEITAQVVSLVIHNEFKMPQKAAAKDNMTQAFLQLTQVNRAQQVLPTMKTLL